MGDGTGEGVEVGKTYDRRTANKRKECAVHVAREYAQEIVSNPGMTSPVPVQPPVGLIEEGSMLRSPKILIGQVQSFVDFQREFPKSVLEEKFQGF